MGKILFSLFFAAIIAVSSSAFAGAGGNTFNDSFNDSKKILERNIYRDHRITFYCGCSYDSRKNVQSCPDYNPVNGGRRSTRIEWEHIVPAAHFGQSFREWREGDAACVDNRGRPFKGRNCASKIAVPYRYMESDMYNLVPAVGEVNGLRSNYRFGMVSGYNCIDVCGMKIDKDARTVEPPKQIRGFIARTYKYMDQAYPGKGIIGKTSEKLFDAWDRQYPVDKWECERCKRIERIQGNENPVVKGQCRQAGLW